MGPADEPAGDQDAETFEAPPPPDVKADPKTGELPAGWEFADD